MQGRMSFIFLGARTIHMSMSDRIRGTRPKELGCCHGMSQQKERSLMGFSPLLLLFLRVRFIKMLFRMESTCFQCIAIQVLTGLLSNISLMSLYCSDHSQFLASAILLGLPFPECLMIIIIPRSRRHKNLTSKWSFQRSNSNLKQMVQLAKIYLKVPWIMEVCRCVTLY